MKFGIKKAAAVMTSVLCVSLCSVSAIADGFTDVPSSYYAYTAINAVVAKGIMTGDSEGKFNPDKYIDKFDTSKMFAMLMGYKYTGASAEENAYYEKAYNNNKDIIAKYSSKFARWNTSTDKEVAFLLARGFYKEEDLEQFVILNSESKEQLRALSKEEMAVFLVRYMGKEKEASEYVSSEKFADDSSIAEQKKGAAYYLKSLFIMTGDSDMKFKPKSAVTRADFCYFLNLAMTKTGLGINYLTNLAPATSTASAATTTSAATPAVAAAPTAASNTGTTSCTIEKFYSSMNIMQVYESNNHRLYKVLTSAAIKINGTVGAVADIPIGSAANITLVNGEITAIDATSTSYEASTQATTQPQTVQQPQTVTQTAVLQTAYTPTESELTVINASVTSSAADAVTVEYKMLLNDGTAKTVSRTYPAAQGCTIIRNGSSQSSLGALAKGDAAELGIYASKVYKVTAKSEDSAKEEKSSSSGTIDGYISAININKKDPTISISETEGGTPAVYGIDSDNVPVYSLKIGDRVRVHAKNGEIKSLSIKKAAEQDFVTGYITTKKSDYIVVEYYDGESLNTKKIYYKKGTTVVTSGVSGDEEEFSDLDEDMMVYAILDDDGKTIDEITIISNN